MFKKRILITQPLIRGFNGSTLVTLELAGKLKELGATVTVYTCDCAEPAKTCFEEKNIHIDTAQSNPKYSISDFDIIWIHSQIIPISIIESLKKKIPSKVPSFIFLHMSGMDWIPDEKPWIYDLENNLSSLSLFICEEVRDVNKKYLDPTLPIGFFRNPAPFQYKSRNHKPSNKLRKMLIVSNHIPEEILEAKNILENKHNITVDILGEKHGNYKLFNEKILDKYDAIITIAKTVPYCLVSGTPVYVYDVWGGGPGWLNEKNFHEAEKRNFSGYQNYLFPHYEGGVFHRKKADIIAKEIIEGYSNSLSYHQQNISVFNQKYLLDSVLPDIFSNLISRNIKPFSKKYADSVIAAERFATIRFETGGLLFVRDDQIRKLEKENERILSNNQYITKENKELLKVVHSHSYQLFNKLITPYKFIKERIKHGR